MEPSSTVRDGKLRERCKWYANTHTHTHTQCQQHSTVKMLANFTIAGTYTDHSEHRKIRSSTAARHHRGKQH